MDEALPPRVWAEPPQKFEAYIPISDIALEDAEQMMRAWQDWHSEMATPEGRAAMEARAKSRAEAWGAHVAQARSDHAELLAKAAGLAGAVLALHAPDESGDCSGCEFSGYEAEPAVWPCSTYRLAAADAGASFETDPAWSWDRLVVGRG